MGGREGVRGRQEERGGESEMEKKHGEGELIVKYEIVLQKARY